MGVNVLPTIEGIETLQHEGDRKPPPRFITRIGVLTFLRPAPICFVMILEAVSTTQSLAFKEQALETLHRLPPFSPVFSKLLGSLSNDEVRVSELADWIERDAIIAGQLLSTVNSAAYGCRGTVSGVRHAVALLGIPKLRNLTLGLSVSRLFSKLRVPAGWSTARYNMHSAACAIMADQMAMHSKVDFGEGAFAAGLLHDIGRMVIALGLPNELALIQKLERETGNPVWQCEQEILGFSHGELSGLILKRWNLPKPIQLAAETHHFPPAHHSQGLVPLGQIVALANETINKMGISIAQTPAPPEDVRALLEERGFEKTQEKILNTFVLEYEAMRTAV